MPNYDTRSSSIKAPGFHGDLIKQQIFTVKKKITSAQIKALFTTPIELIKAPGANKIALPIVTTVAYKHVAPAYTAALGGLFVEWPGSTIPFHSSPILTTNGDVDQLVAESLPPSSQFAVNLSEGVNQPVRLYHSDQNPTLGNGTLIVEILYRIIDLS